MTQVLGAVFCLVGILLINKKELEALFCYAYPILYHRFSGAGKL